MPRILILEDDAEIAFNLSELLSEEGHETDWHRTAGEAREALEHGRFDLLICDIYIYKGGKIVADGGLALIGWIRNAVFSESHAWLQGFPIIAISGATSLPGNHNILEIAESVGADYSLRKPVKNIELFGTINKALNLA